jgi:cytidylate kinase
MSAPIELITISRQFGAGGSELASALGQRLGWPVLDEQLLPRIAEQLGIDLDAVQRRAECPPTFLARLIHAALVMNPPELVIPLDTRGVLTPDGVATASRQILVEAAASLPLIVVGHGAQCIFSGRLDAFHVRLCAPFESRVARLSKRFGFTAEVAAAEMRRVDDARKAYIRRYFQKSWSDPKLYDLEIDSGQTSISEMADSIVELVNSRAADDGTA